MVFATAPSMDGFVSIGAALITNYVKTTYQAHVPLAVIGDTDILAAAPMEMITAGYSWKIHLPFRLENGTHYHRRILLQPYCRYGKRGCRNRCGRKYTN